MSSPDPETTELLEQLTRILDRALRLLGDVARQLEDDGRTDEACRLAAEAWSLVREPAPRAGARLNGTLHYLTRPPRSGNQTGKG